MTTSWFFGILKHWLVIEYYIHIWQVFSQLGLGDSCQLWTWFNWSNKYFCQIRYVPNRKIHDDVIKWKHFLCYRPFVRGIHRPPVNSPHIGQWRGALMFSLIYAWINDWVNNCEAGYLRRHRAHYDVIAMNKGALDSSPVIFHKVCFDPQYLPNNNQIYYIVLHLLQI